MAEASDLTASLLKAQKADGGWGYQTSLSWTEPTAFALLALTAINAKGQAYERGCQWLLANQRSDGGWPPNTQVSVSNAATSPALLALRESSPNGSLDRGIDWLAAQICPELTPWERIQYRWQGRASAETVMGGAPWFPGTASWVSPTVMMVLAFSQAQATRHEVKPLIWRAKEYLLSRRCKKGGWNHGGSQLYSEEAPAYPETTGMALLAFDRADYANISGDLRLAERMLSDPQSAEAQSWLQLALTKHSDHPVTVDESRFPCRTVRDISLRMLAQQAANPNNRLLVRTA